MSQHVIHLNAAASAQGMANAVREYLVNTEHMEAQVLNAEGRGYVVQARDAAGWKNLIGMSKAILVKLNPVSEDSVMVEIGQGKWIDKAVTGVVSWFVLWPLAVTSAVGAYKQAALPRKILQAAEAYAMA